jgi:hypothetical protein
MWREIGIIGRDRLLQELAARAGRKRPSFLLTGPRGSGKTALLEWSYERAPEPKALISAGSTMRDNMIAIARSWGLESEIEKEGRKVPVSRAKIADLERAVLTCPDGLLFIDDIQVATPTFLRRFKIWRERYVVFAAGVPPFAKEELKRTLWGLKTIEVRPLDRKHRQTMAEKVCQSLGASASPRLIAQSSRGYPGRIVAMARGEIDDSNPRVAGEEINLAPILLLGVAGIMAVRYIGLGLGETDLYILGGVGMGVAVFARYFLFQGMRK